MYKLLKCKLSIFLKLYLLTIPFWYRLMEQKYIFFLQKTTKRHIFFAKSLYGLIEKVKSSNISPLDNIFDVKTQQKQ